MGKRKTSKAEERTVAKDIRWTPSEWTRVVKVARQNGLTPSGFIRQATLRAIAKNGTLFDQKE